MTAAVRKVRRRSRGDELSIEQTRDLTAVAAILDAAGISADGLELPGACFVMAYRGDQPVGVAGIETRVDAALIQSLYVVESSRRRGIGAALLRAARAAAHTRGARVLYAFGHAEAGAYLRRFGFEPVAREDALGLLAGMFTADRLRVHPDEMALVSAFTVDISQDGVILR